MQKKEQVYENDNEIVISDTCVLISFEKINNLELLHHFYKNLYITKDVYDEYTKGGVILPDFINIKEINNIENIKKYLDLGLHKGEASSLALYMECKNPLFLTDDGDARDYAEKNKLNYLTTLDIIIEGREIGYIKTNDDLHNILDKLLVKKRRFSKNLIDEIKNKYPIINEKDIKAKIILSNMGKGYGHIIKSVIHDFNKNKNLKNKDILNKIIDLYNKAVETKNNDDLIYFHNSLYKDPITNDSYDNNFRYRKVFLNNFLKMENIIKNEIKKQFSDKIDTGHGR